MMRALALSALVLFAVVLPPDGHAATQSPAPVPAPAHSANDLALRRIDAMLRAGHADPAWFSASFLVQISAAQVDTVIAGLMPVLGAYQSVAPTSDAHRFVAHFLKGSDAVLIYLDAAEKIDRLLFRPPHLVAASLDDALSPLARVSGTVSYVVAEQGRSELAARDASTPLAVGSAFKLAVLSALLDQIAHGHWRWSDVVALQSDWKSEPSGVLQTWPSGAPLTLATYATEMISISDNTAADALVRIVGPAALARYAAGNEPFLTTREAFVLKSDGETRLRGMYFTVDSPAARAAVLRQVDALPMPSPDAYETKPDLAIEWHYSVRELCRMMWRVAALPLMSVNPGVADTTDFARVAYKGGSDTGVLNLTTAVTTHRGTRLCLSATVNDVAPIDERAFEAHYAAALRALADR
jgi:beta-lactamase class A